MSGKKKKINPGKTKSINLKTWHYAALILLPLIVYGRSIGFGYVMHDDDKMITDNPVLEEGFDLGTAFTTDAWFMDARIELYRPWQSISYMMDYAVGKEEAWIYRLHNILVYVLGVWLLFIFLKMYFPPLLAWGGTLLYGVNLLTPHAAGWIAARGDLYLMVFGLLFLILLARYFKNGKPADLWLSLPAFFLALLSKESAVALLPVAAVMFWFRKNRKPNGSELTWGALVLAVFAGYYVMRGKAIADAGNMSVTAFFSNLRSIPEELIKMVVPYGFSVMPGYSMILTLAGTLLLIGFVYWTWRAKPDPKILFTGLTLCLASLLPSMAYEPSFAGVAYDYLDHRTWLPFVGIWMIGLGNLKRLEFPLPAAKTYAFLAALIIWSAINVWRIGTYENWKTYYDNAIATNPNSGLAQLNYGSMLRDEGRWEEALPFVEKGVALSPDYVDAKVRLAEVYFKLGWYDDAINIATRALEKEPNNVSALQFRGSAYGASGRPGEASSDFSKVLEIEPDNPHGLFNLGMAWKDANRLNEALEMYTKLIEVSPDFPNAYYERGFTYGRMNQFALAKQDLDQSIQRQPDHGVSYFFRGRALDALGDKAGACRDWRKALELGVEEARGFVENLCAGF